MKMLTRKELEYYEQQARAPISLDWVACLRGKLSTLKGREPELYRLHHNTYTGKIIVEELEKVNNPWTSTRLVFSFSLKYSKYYSTSVGPWYRVAEIRAVWKLLEEELDKTLVNYLKTSNQFILEDLRAPIPRSQATLCLAQNTLTWSLK